ncbi:MAG: hypothetical protein EOP50_01905 [Sphingobacteriales bacterium]|nr:MAG: hypothetical protein EOP50_01905 [Sphingobacteriales bacterium]
MSATLPKEAKPSTTRPARIGDISSGLALGFCFAIAVALLVAGIILSPASDGAPGTARRIIIGGLLGCSAGLLALAASLIPFVRRVVLPPILLVAFLVVVAYSALTVRRDLTLISYTQHSHPSLALEDIAATSPAFNERTTYYALYALRRRIAGSHLAIDPSLPLDKWHLRYRADLADVVNLPDSLTMPLPSLAETDAWAKAGGLVLPLMQSKRLVLPPEMAKPGVVPAGSAFAITKVDDTTYALVRTDGVIS